MKTDEVENKRILNCGSFSVLFCGKSKRSVFIIDYERIGLK